MSSVHGGQQLLKSSESARSRTESPFGSLRIITTFGSSHSVASFPSMHCLSWSAEPAVGNSSASEIVRRCTAVNFFEFNGQHALRISKGYGSHSRCACCSITSGSIGFGSDSDSNSDPESNLAPLLVSKNIVTWTSGTSPSFVVMATELLVLGVNNSPPKLSFTTMKWRVSSQQQTLSEPLVCVV